MLISTITCTYNPDIARLKMVLDALIGQQAIDPSSFEIIIVDNRSTPTVASQLPDQYNERVRIVREETLGLTAARLCGLRNATAETILMVDDDNVLDPDYLSHVFDSFASRPRLGAIGGKAIPVFKETPPNWFSIERYSLGCRDLGETFEVGAWPASGERVYPRCAPIGGGMAIRRALFEAYDRAITGDSLRKSLDRTGNSLASGGDNDLVLTVLDNGFEVAYDPRLRMHHHIPAGRTTLEYLKRYQRDTNRTWVQVLAVHGICPWPSIAGWTAPLRKLKSFFRTRAWRSPVARLEWCAACGLIDGQASLRHLSST